MTEADRANFARLLAGVMAIYNRDVSEFALGVWWNACRSYDMDQIRAAFNQHVMDPETGQFPPKPADIVRQLQGTHGDRSLIAWGKAFDAMQKVGAYESVVFDDGVIHAVVEDLGGWPALCKTSNDELPFVQRRFCDAYRAYSRRAEKSFPPRLAGITESTNGPQFAHRNTPPILIGNVERAKRVMALGAEGARVEYTSLASVTERVVKRLAADTATRDAS